MRCYRRLLNISYKDHVTNEEVRNRIQNAIGVHDDLLTMVKKRKLRWYGHISRSSGIAKTVLQGIVKGARRRGRQKKRLEDNIKEWMGMSFGDSLRAAEDGWGWKGIVAKSSVVPRWPPRLRDWDEMRWCQYHTRDWLNFQRKNIIPILYLQIIVDLSWINLNIKKPWTDCHYDSKLSSSEWKMSLVLRKLHCFICKQQKCRSACASMLSDQGLYYSLPR